MNSKKLFTILGTVGSLAVSSIVSAIFNFGSEINEFVQAPSELGVPTSTTIKSMLNDKNGNFWVATDNSTLYERMNGQEHFGKIVINGLSGGQPIYFIFEDQQNNIWIGTAKGLYEKLSNSTSFEKYTNIPSVDGEFSSMCQDQAGTIWLTPAYKNNILYKLSKNENNFLAIETKSSAASEIIADKSNNIWFLNDEGEIWMANTNTNTVNFSKFESNVISSSGKDEHILKIYCDSANNLWIGSQTRVYKKTASNKDFQKTNLEKPIAETKSGGTPMINEDNQNNIWVATEKNGLFEKKANGNNFVEFTNGLPADLGMRCVTQDQYGYIWLGTNKKGLYISNFQNLPNSKSENSLSVGAIIGIIIGVAGGITLISLGTYFYGKKTKVSNSDHSQNLES